jgi:hypothetical protein
MQKLMDIRAAARPVASPLEVIASRVAALIASPEPPSDAVIESLVHRDVRDLTLAVLNPGGLIDILRFSIQAMKPYRLARYFHAIPLKCELFGLPELRLLDTPQARLARAALADIDWPDASPDERKVLLTRHVLNLVAIAP